MNRPIIYNYDAATRIFIETELADPDPKTPGSFLDPAHSTRVPLPKRIPAGTVPVFDPDGNTWKLMAAALFEQKAAPEPEIPLEQIKAMTEASLDRQFEVLYAKSVPNAAIATEYSSAYQSAKAWLDAGAIAQAAPARVLALAETMSTDAQEAAQHVVQKWQEAEYVLDRRGAARLRAKAAVRAAADRDAVTQAHSDGILAMAAVTFNI